MNDEWLVIDTPELKALYAPSKDGDQSYSIDYLKTPKWTPKNADEGFMPEIAYRRLRRKAWLAVKDVPPQYPCWLSDGSGVRFCHNATGTIAECFTHWQPAPHAPPPPQEEWERAYSEYVKVAHWGTRDSRVCEAFKAGWKARGK